MSFENELKIKNIMYAYDAGDITLRETIKYLVKVLERDA